MSKLVEKRTVDMQIIGDWVEPGSRVLDLGCGRGVLLDYLQQTKQVRGLGVDLDFQKILGCVRRGVTAYQGDMEAFMHAFPDRFFDRVICSRTVQELTDRRPSSWPPCALVGPLRLDSSITAIGRTVPTPFFAVASRAIPFIRPSGMKAVRPIRSRSLTLKVLARPGEFPSLAARSSAETGIRPARSARIFLPATRCTI